MTTDKPVTDRLFEIAAMLLNKTRSSALTWRATDDEDAFLYSGSKSSLIIDYNPGQDEYELRLLNQRGTVVESLTTAWEVVQNPSPWEDANRPAKWNDTLMQLHDAARRSALDIDGLLDSTLADIESEPPF